MSLKNNEIKKKMLQLGLDCINPPDESLEEKRKHGLKMFPMKKFESQGEDDKGCVIIEGKDYALYESLIQLISKEPHAEHLSTRDVDEELSNFVMDVLNNIERYKDQGKIKEKINETILKLLKPFEDWIVISPLENLSTELEKISFGNDYFIQKITHDSISYFKNSSIILEKFFSPTMNKTCIFVNVKANNKQSAQKKGSEKIRYVLNLLRVYFGSDYFHNIQDPHIFLAFPKTEQTITISYHANRKPDCNIRKDHTDTLQNFITLTQEFITGSLPARISERIYRAIRWFGMGIQDDNLDDKLTKYFIALEALFVPETEGKKGERLAHRIALLQYRHDKGFTEPDKNLQLYEKRSRIVHGGDAEEIPVTEGDVRHLEWITKNAILYACQYIQEKNFRKINELVRWIESDDEITKGVNEFISKYCSEPLREYVNKVFSTQVV